MGFTQTRKVTKSWRHMPERRLKSMCIDEDPQSEPKPMNVAVMKQVSAMTIGVFSVLGMFCALSSTTLSQVQVEILDTVNISESHYYGYFPSLQMLSTGELICDISMDPDQHSVEGA